MDASALLVVMLTVAALAVFVTIMGAAVYLGVRQSKERPRKAPEPLGEPVWAARVAALEVKVDSLPGLWEEERRRAEQARDRERYYASKSARKRREADEADEDDSDVPGGDAGGGPVQGMLPLPGDLGSGPAPSEPAHITRARQMGYPWSFLS